MRLTRQQWREVLDSIVTFAMPVALLAIILLAGACPILRRF